MAKKKLIQALIGFTLFSASVGAAAQLALPVVPSIGLPGGDLTNPVGGTLENLDISGLTGRQLDNFFKLARVDRLTDFVRSNRDAVEFDVDQNPAVRGRLVATSIDDAAIARATAAGFAVQSSETIEGLDLAFVSFAVPVGMSLKKAEKRLQKLAPQAEIDADNLYFTSGQAPELLSGTVLAAGAAVKSVSLGLIDGGVAAHPSIKGGVEQKGFVRGAPQSSSHGTSVAALMVGSGEISGGSPGKSLLVADVYGNDPAGGNATAIAKGLGWLAGRGISVVTISLVGPDNALLKKAVSAAQKRGVLIVAAVGNDGPAAPKPFPASYYGVLGVTGVDGRRNALPEAGRSPSLAFAAPGADIKSATVDGKLAKVRGTSFAAPLVAGRLAQFYPGQSKGAIEGAVRKLMAEAVDLGKKGFDPIYGNGLICGQCGAK